MVAWRSRRVIDWRYVVGSPGRVMRFVFVVTHLVWVREVVLLPEGFLATSGDTWLSQPGARVIPGLSARGLGRC